jgi:photosystem II stability/assembly factor-like uncharacterized protein
MATTRWILATACLLAACSEDDDGTTGNGTTSGGAWIVGDDGAMLRSATAGFEDYPAAPADDLLAIACHGTDHAFVATGSGRLLSTHDAGHTWDAMAIVGAARLTAVAVSSATDVWVAGAGGLLAVSRDFGATFERVAAPTLDFTAVATSADASVTFVASSEGTVYRVTGSSVTAEHAVTSALRGLSVTPAGDAAAAVGDDGTVARFTSAAAAAWSVDAPATPRHLYAVRLGSDGTHLVAVGEAGVVLRMDPAGTAVEEILEPGSDLLALHLSSDGEGHAVGSHGIVLGTTDGGVTWTPIASGTATTLRGIDDLHGEPHL